MSTSWHRLAMLAAVVVFGGGCSFDLEACGSDDDCPDGSRCHRPPGTDVPMCLHGPLTSTNNATTGPTSGTTGPQTTAPRPNDSNNGEMPDDSSPPGTCSDVEQCGADEPNDRLRNAVLLNDEPAGCPGFALESWVDVRRDEACEGDVDTYALRFVPCETDSFEIDVRVETSEHCSERALVELMDEEYRCGDSDVRCTVETRAEGFTVIVGAERGDRDVEEILFTVRPEGPDEAVQYIVRASIDR